MVHLNYINDPFDAKMMKSISDFYDEKSFYDCINRRFLNAEAFRHLEHSFYTYFFTGDSGEWIGYALFSNEDRIKGYYDFSCLKALDLLNDFKGKFGNLDNEKELAKLEKLITENRSNPGICSILEEVLDILSKLDINDFDMFNNMILNYQQELQDYLLQFPEYFYLDVVIALPKEEQFNIVNENSNSNLSVDLLVELKYYGFIREVFALVENEMQRNFKDIPILLRKENQNILANANSLPDDKKLSKQL